MKTPEERRAMIEEELSPFIDQFEMPDQVKNIVYQRILTLVLESIHEEVEEVLKRWQRSLDN